MELARGREPPAGIQLKALPNSLRFDRSDLCRLAAIGSSLKIGDNPLDYKLVVVKRVFLNMLGETF